jgi:CRISPR-associated protein Cas1
VTHLYVTEHDARISVRGNLFIVSFPSGGVSQYPAETVESLSLFGRYSLTSSVINTCLRNKIDVFFYSGSGSFFGRISSPETVSVAKLRRQVELSGETAFALEIAKSIVRAKIVNQMALLEAYDPGDLLTGDLTAPMMHSLASLAQAPTLNALVGYEGNAARAYFRCLGLLVPPEFAFSGRSRRPPKDRFNSMLSLGYSLLHRSILGAIERHGFNAFFGFLHVDRENHAALVSDLMEEWRPIIVEDTVLSLANDGDITPSMFETDAAGAVTLRRDALRTFVAAIREKLLTAEPYLPGDDKLYTFQSALDAQLTSLWHALETREPYYYHPVSVEEP